MSWKAGIPTEELNRLAAAGYGGKVELGRSPCLLVVDVTYGFTGRSDLEAEENSVTFPKSAPETAWQSIPKITKLIGTFRSHEWPVVMTTNTGRLDWSARGRWLDKVDDTKDRSPVADDIVAEIAEMNYGHVLAKTKPSAFFGTPLVSWLNTWNIDTVVVAGGTTSGCVRASVLDSFSYNYATVVVEDGVFDRSQPSHTWSLFDMSMKYAEVMDSDDILDHLIATE